MKRQEIYGHYWSFFMEVEGLLARSQPELTDEALYRKTRRELLNALDAIYWKDDRRELIHFIYCRNRQERWRIRSQDLR